MRRESSSFVGGMLFCEEDVCFSAEERSGGRYGSARKRSAERKEDDVNTRKGFRCLFPASFYSWMGDC
jgi:hypothetical protein